MSGPVTAEDAGLDKARSDPELATVEITESRQTRVGAFDVRRALPRRGRRTVGAWCFADHMGPARVTPDHGLDVAPHPHLGLQTVTWLLAGEAVHRDSLGSEQVIRPGELNLMTAGHGVAHSEERTGRYDGELHGVQLWVAQPEISRGGAAAFEQHTQLPKFERGQSVLTVLVGEMEGATAPTRRDTDHVGVDLDLRGAATELPLQPDYEYGLVVFSGRVTIAGQDVVPGHLAYFGTGRDECTLTTAEPTRALLLGGVPFDEPILMWWNFVGGSQAEISAAYLDWVAGERFGPVASTLPRTEVGPPPWMHRPT
jgi:quercetin 2,3-dioxygenase